MKRRREQGDAKERLDAATPWATRAAPVRGLPEYNNPAAGHPPWRRVRSWRAQWRAG